MVMEVFIVDNSSRKLVAMLNLASLSLYQKPKKERIKRLDHKAMGLISRNMLVELTRAMGSVIVNM